jgi:hypothetical protein
VDNMEAQQQPATALLGLARVCQRASAAAAYRISPRVAPTKRKRPARRSSILDGEVKDLWRLSRIGASVSVICPGGNATLMMPPDTRFAKAARA